jgi:hypothetical protein
LESRSARPIIAVNDSLGDDVMHDDDSYRTIDAGLFPVVSVQKGPFSRRIDVSGCGACEQEVTFDSEVRWLRMSSSALHLVNVKGERVETRGGTCLDYDRLLTPGDLLELHRAAERECVRYGCDVSTFLGLRIVTSVYDYPLVKTYDNNLSHLPCDWYPHGSARLVDQWLDKPSPDTPSPFLRPATVVEGEVWSSRKTMDENAFSFEALLDKALKGLSAEDSASVRRRLAEAELIPEAA